MISYSKNMQGFSLIEIAIVMVILGFLIGGLMKPLGRQMEASQVMTTRKAIDEFRTAALGFALINGRLPCPDVDGDGLEDQVGGAICPAAECAALEGEPAWATLGTSREDAWGQPFIYQVSARFAYDASCPDNCVPPALSTPNVAFQLCSTGTIQVTEGNDGTYSGAAVANALPMVILSTGKNRGASMPDENENTDGDSNFVKRKFNEVPAHA